MPSHVPPRRDFSQLEQRRKEAGRMFAAGKLILSSIARELKVSRQSVSRWYAEWKNGGTVALKGAGRAGRKSRMEAGQLLKVERALRRGPRAHGFETDLWTLPRVAKVVERLTGVRYHSGHIWKILGTMDWTLQRPARQARERNPEKVRLWLEQRWPEVKKKLADKGPGSSSRTKAASRNAPLSTAHGHPKAKRRS
jgi:transposase